MDQWIVEVLKQVPSLAVLAWITSQFLADRSRRDASLLSYEVERDKQMRATLSESNLRSHEVIRDAIAVMQETKVELARVGEVAVRLIDAIEHLSPTSKR